ncbi:MULTISPECIES: nuclear transport factor 2 family protein [Streptacidiphilus]|uniref:Nuclear transport factor 2 family protein n=1 Tax=Streptacidiphilus cavernicola TaxID=3342716 RepID=A0ABV6UN23_9ACTN|nr:nuclear transport factor 2 family protein [Streptacidiphilus jeojiense]
MSQNTRTARETVDLMLHTIVHGTRDDLADLYAPDTVITNPFAPDGVPASVTGNEQLRARMKAMGDLIRYHSVDDVTVHETREPGTVVVEFGVSGTIVASGTPFSLRFVNIVRVMDGLIAESRDYSDSVRAAQLFELLAVKVD